MRIALLILLLISNAYAGKLYYTGKDFQLNIPAESVSTIEVPCEVSATAYSKQKLQVKVVKLNGNTLVYLLPSNRKSVLSLSCLDRTYVFKLNPVNTRPEKKLVCKNGTCHIVEVKPKIPFKSLDVSYQIVDPQIVSEKVSNAESSFEDKKAVIDSAVKLISASVLNRKPAGYVVRKKKLSYMLTPDIKVDLVRFYKGLLYGQVVKLTNESVFAHNFSVKELDGNGNVLLYSPSMDKNGVIHFRPKQSILLYVVQVKNRLKLPFIYSRSVSYTSGNNGNNYEAVPVQGLHKSSSSSFSPVPVEELSTCPTCQESK